GQIDRGALATVVFNDRDALAWLEELLHPLVAAEYLQWREPPAGLAPPPAVSGTEVPPLRGTRAHPRLHKAGPLTAPKKLRSMRSQVAVDDREPRFLPDSEKAERADYVFRNLGSLEELDAFVASVMDDLTGS